MIWQGVAGAQLFAFCFVIVRLIVAYSALIRKLVDHIDELTEHNGECPESGSRLT